MSKKIESIATCLEATMTKTLGAKVEQLQSIIDRVAELTSGLPTDRMIRLSLRLQRKGMVVSAEAVEDYLVAETRILAILSEADPLALREGAGRFDA